MGDGEQHVPAVTNAAHGACCAFQMPMHSKNADVVLVVLSAKASLHENKRHIERMVCLSPDYFTTSEKLLLQTQDPYIQLGKQTVPVFFALNCMDVLPSSKCSLLPSPAPSLSSRVPATKAAASVLPPASAGSSSLVGDMAHVSVKYAPSTVDLPQAHSSPPTAASASTVPSASTSTKPDAVYTFSKAASPPPTGSRPVVASEYIAQLEVSARTKHLGWSVTLVVSSG